MNKLFILLLLLATASCSSDSPTQETLSISQTEKEEASQKSLSPFTITQAAKSDFEAAQKKFDTPLLDSTEFRKTGGVLKLPTQEGYHPYVIFTDTLQGTDDDEIREYNYLGSFKTVPYYMVSGSFWEHYEIYLISKDKGQIHTLWNDPFLSPDSKYLANLSLPYGLEGIPNGFQVWEINTSNHALESFELEKLVEVDQQSWAPYEMVWENNSSFLIKALPTEAIWSSNVFDKSGNIKDLEKLIYLRVKLK